MKGRYLKKIGGIILAALMLSGVAFVSAGTIEAQHRRRVIIVRPYRPLGWGHRWGSPYGRWGYDAWSPYGSAYRQYVFSSTDSASKHGYEQGFKTGKDDGKKRRALATNALTTSRRQASATSVKFTVPLSREVTRRAIG